jgi:hypothetical protein
MAYQKLQVSEGLSVIPSDTVRIPDPSSVVVLDTTTRQTEGTANFGTNTLTIATPAAPRFSTAGIQVGAIVYNTTTNVAYTVTGITSDTVLAITPATTGGATDSFTIYNKPTTGCILYVGGTGNLTVQMAQINGNTTTAATPANQTVAFNNLPNASFLPLQVVRVASTGTAATGIIALW